MKRVLVISYYWPPSGGSGVQRWVKMCKYLPERGWQPVVYTPSNPALTSTDDTLAADIPAGVEVIRRPILEPGQFAKKTTAAQVTPINGQKKTFRQRVAMWIRGNLFIPDPRVLWVRPSVRFLSEYLKGHPVDAIVSTGPPQSMHLIARAVARRTGIPWVADFRDPWTRMFYFKHLCLSPFARRRHEKLEKAVLDEATRIVAVSPLVRKDFEAMTSTAVELITNGFDPDDFPTASAGTGEDKSAVPPATGDMRDCEVWRPFILLHAGLFAADGNPLNVWEALGQLVKTNPEFSEKFKLQLCGKTDRAVTDAINAAGLERHTEDLGYVSHKDVVRLMQDASVLLLPLRREPEYKATLPGKLFEYLASRKPVIGIGQKDGAMAAILEDTNSGRMFEWDEVEPLREHIALLFAEYKENKPAGNGRNIDCYSRPAIAARYAALLDEITDTK